MPLMKSTLIVFLSSLLAAAMLLGAAGAPEPESPAAAVSSPPEWFVAHMAFLAQGSGRWIADNTPYKSEGEPYDAYGTEWKYALGKKSLVGRLFALRDGSELGDIWQFRLFWDPGTRRARVLQFGSDGTFGDGTVGSTGEGVTRAEQEFWSPDGSTTSIGHDTTESPGEHVTQSWDLAPDGTWTKRRRYSWKLVG